MDRRTMMTTLAGGVMAVGDAGRASAAQATDSKLPVASANAAKDFPGRRNCRIGTPTTKSCSPSPRK